MKKISLFVLLGVLFGVIPPLLPAQQIQGIQTSDPEIEALKQRVSQLEKQLQTVENVEKLELQAKLAEANTKLINAEFGKFERDLRDSNSRLVKDWVIISLAFLSVVGVSIWSWLRSRTNQLIADAVEKNLNGFKEAVDQVDTLKKQTKQALEELDTLKIQQREIEKKDAIAALFRVATSGDPEQRKPPYSEEINSISDELLLHIVDGGTTEFYARIKAAEVLVDRESLEISTLLLKILNSAADREDNQPMTNSLDPGNCVFILGKIHTHEVYQGLRAFLNRVLSENPRNMDTYMSGTVTSLAGIGVKLNLGDSVPVLKLAIPLVKELHREFVSALTAYFDKFNEPEGIKEILTQHGINNKLRYTEEICLRALEKYDSKFVEEWRAGKASDGAEA